MELARSPGSVVSVLCAFSEHGSDPDGPRGPPVWVWRGTARAAPRRRPSDSTHTKAVCLWYLSQMVARV